MFSKLYLEVEVQVFGRFMILKLFKIGYIFDVDDILNYFIWSKLVFFLLTRKVYILINIL